ncbi:hypothetical protein ANTPLA_LOCUS5452 [Anthophora plagiata]
MQPTVCKDFMENERPDANAFVIIVKTETGRAIGKNTYYTLSAFWHMRRKGESVKDEEKEITKSEPAIRRT